MAGCKRGCEVSNMADDVVTREGQIEKARFSVLRLAPLVVVASMLSAADTLAFTASATPRRYVAYAFLSLAILSGQAMLARHVAQQLLLRRSDPATWLQHCRRCARSFVVPVIVLAGLSCFIGPYVVPRATALLVANALLTGLVFLGVPLLLWMRRSRHREMPPHRKTTTAAG